MLRKKAELAAQLVELAARCKEARLSASRVALYEEVFGRFGCSCG